MKHLVMAALAAALIGIGVSAYAYSCTTTCYNVGNQRVCNTNCF